MQPFRTQPRFLAAAIIVGVAIGLLPSQIISLRTTHAVDATQLEHAGDFPGMRYRAVPDDGALDDAAVRRARRVTLAHPALARRGDPRIVSVRPYGPFARGEVSASDPCLDRACVNVTVVLPPTTLAFEVYVDADSGRVLSLERSAGQPALSEAEGRLAHRLAEADPETRALVGAEAHRHPWVLAKPMWPAGVCDLHRCGTVIFTFGDLPETGIGRQLNVLVDLTANTVLERTPITCDPGCRVGWSA